MPTRSNVVARLSGTLDRKGVDTHIERCVHTRHRAASCVRCVQACPVGAISLVGAICVDTKKCTGCGVCTTVCPSGAFEAVSPSAFELCGSAEAQAQQSQIVTFCCENHVAGADDTPEDAITVPCMGRIDESILLAAAAAGAETICLLDGDCGSCERKRGSDVAICAAQQVNCLLEAVGASSRLSIQSRPSAGAMLRAAQADGPESTSRRAFFAMLWGAAERVKERVTAAAVSGESHQRLAGYGAGREEDVKYVPARWRIMRTALKNVHHHPGASIVNGDLWADITISNGCNGCQICAKSCPTGALAKTEQDGRVELTFTAAHCTGCNVCAEVCCWNAIHVTSAVDLRRVIEGTTAMLALHEKETVEDLTAPMECKFNKLLGMP